MPVTLVQHGDYTSEWDERTKRFVIKLKREHPIELLVPSDTRFNPEKLTANFHRVSVNMEKRTIDGLEQDIQAVVAFLMNGKPKVMDDDLLLWFTSQIDFACKEFFKDTENTRARVWKVLCEGCGIYARTFFGMQYACDYIREPSCKCNTTMHLFEVSNRQDSRFVAAVEPS